MNKKAVFTLATVFLFLGITLAFLPADSTKAAGESECITCHRDENPGLVDQWLSGKMSNAGLDCATCHGGNHVDENDVDEAIIPTPDTCASCHKTQVDQFRAGKHSLAWAAIEAMPAWSHLPDAIQSVDGYKSCSGCHKIGERSHEVIEEYRMEYGTSACTSCHTRHVFSKAEAQQPEACLPCHQGFDHPQYEMWSSSKHGVIHSIDPDSGRAPTCQNCHLVDGTHNNITPWGFLGLRLPEEDDEWMADRAVILQALGVLDDDGNPTARLDVIAGARVARLDAEEFQTLRDGMTAVCKDCHSKDYVALQMSASENILKDADKLMAEGILVVKDLYDQGVLKLPEGYEFGPDLLQFFSTGSSVEQELFQMFLEYRNRTFMGAFHNNPDYMWWYGYAPMQKSLQTIKDDAALLKAQSTTTPSDPGSTAVPGDKATPGWVIGVIAGVAILALVLSISMFAARRK
jgi:hydroxylamine dehydrogenase